MSKDQPFSIYPVQGNHVKYLSGNNSKAVSSLGEEYESSYFEFNRELELDQYDDELCSKFTKIKKLVLTGENQKQSVPREKLSVLVSLQVCRLDKNVINLRDCTRLEKLTCKIEETLSKEDFPLTLKMIDCSDCTINDTTIDNFPVSLEEINLKRCHDISTFNINHLVNLKKIDCSQSTITDAVINNFLVSLEEIDLLGCANISTFNIQHLMSLKIIDCSSSTITDAAINNFPVSLEEIKLMGCQKIRNFNINHLVKLKKIYCRGSSITDRALENFPVSLETRDLNNCKNIVQ
uniref:Uncharacterized protein n=1 Tax=Cacopsylla melanoneura TaxID=428564 RepID=A0A8D8WI41_9HEMI